jgi:hypothetical protein
LGSLAQTPADFSEAAKPLVKLTLPETFQGINIDQARATDPTADTVEKRVVTTFLPLLRLL